MTRRPDCAQGRSSQRDGIAVLQYAIDLNGYSTRTNLMTAPEGFCVSTSEFPFTANSYRLPAPPMANALFATMAFVASTLPVTVYVPVLR